DERIRRGVATTLCRGQRRAQRDTSLGRSALDARLRTVHGGRRDGARGPRLHDQRAGPLAALANRVTQREGGIVSDRRVESGLDVVGDATIDVGGLVLLLQIGDIGGRRRCLQRPLHAIELRGVLVCQTAQLARL